MSIDFPRHSLLALCLCALAPAALAGSPINERRPLKPDAIVKVSSVAGAVEVQAWDRDELQLTGELGEGVEALEITGTATEITVRVKHPEKGRDVEETNLRLNVPAGIDLRIDAVSADVQVQGIRGPVT